MSNSIQSISRKLQVLLLIAAGLATALLAVGVSLWLAEPAGSGDTSTASIVLMALGVAAVGLVVFALSYRIARHTVRELEQAGEAARERRIRDALTGDLNRTGLLEALGADPAGWGMLVLEIEGLDALVSESGHDAGDEAIRLVSRRIAAVARKQDCIARIATDSFAIARRNTTHDELQRMASQLLAAVALPIPVAQREYLAQARLGIALADGSEIATPESGAPQALLRRASLAGRRSVPGTRAQVTVYEPELEQAQERRRKLENRVRRAAIHEDFDLHFQPIFSVRTGRPVAFEALLRLHAGEGKILTPEQLIPVAEELDLVSSIGIWVLHRACLAACTWPEALGVSVNISGAQLIDGSVVEAVDYALRETGLAPQRLRLELRGAVLNEAGARARDRLVELQALGVQILLDDFGGSANDLTHLCNMPIDGIKLDRRLTAAMSEDPMRVGAALKATAQLAHSLGLAVHAVGVETPGQRDLLQACGVEQWQGFLFERPMPEEDVPEFLHNRDALALQALRDGRTDWLATPLP